MAIKIKKKYRVVSAMNPKTGVKDLLRPVVTERETYYSDNIVEYALKNGYVRGQYHDMLGALNGFIQAVQELGKEGKDVNLSNWLRVHGELTGTVDPENPILTEKNMFHVNITALKELKRKASDFSWTKVESAAEDGDKSPALTSFVQLNAAGVVEAVGKMITIYDMIEVKGKNLPEGIKGRYALYDKDSGELKTATEWEANPSHTMFERVSSTTVRAQFKVNATPYPDGMWLDEGHPIKFEVKLPDESIISIALPLV